MRRKKRNKGKWCGGKYVCRRERRRDYVDIYIEKRGWVVVVYRWRRMMEYRHGEWIYVYIRGIENTCIHAHTQCYV